MSDNSLAPEYTNMNDEQAFKLKNLLLDKNRWLNDEAYKLFIEHFVNNPTLPISKEYLYGLIYDNIKQVVDDGKSYSLTLAAARQGVHILNETLTSSVLAQKYNRDKLIPASVATALPSKKLTPTWLSMRADNRPYLSLPNINNPNRRKGIPTNSSIFKLPNPKKGGGGYKKQHQKGIHKKSTRNNKRKSRKTKRRKTMKT